MEESSTEGSRPRTEGTPAFTKDGKRATRPDRTATRAVAEGRLSEAVDGSNQRPTHATTDARHHRCTLPPSHQGTHHQATTTPKQGRGGVGQRNTKTGGKRNAPRHVCTRRTPLVKAPPGERCTGGREEVDESGVWMPAACKRTRVPSRGRPGTGVRRVATEAAAAAAATAPAAATANR